MLASGLASQSAAVCRPRPAAADWKVMGVMGSRSGSDVLRLVCDTAALRYHRNAPNLFARLDSKFPNAGKKSCRAEPDGGCVVLDHPQRVRSTRTCRDP